MNGRSTPFVAQFEREQGTPGEKNMSQKPANIPRFYLYGDQVSDVELNFVHVEQIRERSGAHDWIIRAHAHPDHLQILLVEHGGGDIRIEGQTYDIPPESIIVIPATMVHEIHFRPGTDGIVVTSAVAYASSVSQGDVRLMEGMNAPDVYPIGGTGIREDAVRDTFAWLNREYNWSAPGRRVSIMALFIRVMVSIMRLRSVRTTASAAAGDRNYDILMRYKELVEQNFQNEKLMEFYAGKIGVSPQRLNQACKARSGKTASELLHERIIIEAKRFLLYVDMTVAEIGYELGFDDPAYFSRFFSQRVGQPPGNYRASSSIRQEAVAEPG